MGAGELLIPCCSDDGKTDAEGDAQICPRIRRNRCEESSDLSKCVSVLFYRSSIAIAGRGRAYVECLAAASKQHIWRRQVSYVNPRIIWSRDQRKLLDLQAPTISRAVEALPRP